MIKLSPRLDKHVKVGPRADEKCKKYVQSRQKVKKMRPKSVRTPITPSNW